MDHRENCMFDISCIIMCVFVVLGMSLLIHCLAVTGEGTHADTQAAYFYFFKIGKKG
jgi:hypothetical protein